MARITIDLNLPIKISFRVILSSLRFAQDSAWAQRRISNLFTKRVFQLKILRGI